MTDQKQQNPNRKYQHIYDSTTGSWQRHFLQFQTIITNLQIKANKINNGKSKTDHNIAADVCNLKSQRNYIEIAHDVQNVKSIHCTTCQQLNYCIRIHVTTKYNDTRSTVLQKSTRHTRCPVMLLSSRDFLNVKLRCSKSQGVSKADGWEEGANTVNKTPQLQRSTETMLEKHFPSHCLVLQQLLNLPVKLK